MVDAVTFALTYLYSWLLIGAGVFLTFGVAIEVRRDAKRRAAVQQGAVVAGGGSALPW